MPDVFLFDLRKENDYGGFDLPDLTRDLSAAIPVADILVEIEHVLRVVADNGSVEQLQHELGTIRHHDGFTRSVPSPVARFH